MSSRGSILIVDDEQSIAAFLAELFRDEGYSVRTAADGAQALEAIIDQIPDLVLLDVMMPRMDGDAVLQRIREQDIGQFPVIMMSAGVNLTTFLEKGAIAVVAKPIVIDMLLVLVSKHLAPPQQDEASR